MTLQEPSRLVFVHGWCGSAEAWAPIVSLLGRDTSVSLETVRLPGSPGSLPGGPYTVAAAAARVIDKITASAQPVTLIGHSMGAQVTLLAHIHAPELVVSEIVIDPAYGADDDESRAMENWARRIEVSGHSELEAFFAEAYVPSLPVTARERIHSDLLATPVQVIADYLRSEYVDADAIGLRSATRLAATRRTQPVLALHSTPGGAALESTLSAPPGSQVERWAGHGHYMHLEDPGRFARRVAEWLDTQPRRHVPHGDGLVTKEAG